MEHVLDTALYTLSANTQHTQHAGRRSTLRLPSIPGIPGILYTPLPLRNTISPSTRVVGLCFWGGSAKSVHAPTALPAPT